MQRTALPAATCAVAVARVPWVLMPSMLIIVVGMAFPCALAAESGKPLSTSTRMQLGLPSFGQVNGSGGRWDVRDRGLLSPDGISPPAKAGLTASPMPDPREPAGVIAPRREPPHSGRLRLIPSRATRSPRVEDRRGEPKERDERNGDMNNDGAAFGLKLHTGRYPGRPAIAVRKGPPTNRRETLQNPLRLVPECGSGADFGRLPDPIALLEASGRPRAPFLVRDPVG